MWTCLRASIGGSSDFVVGEHSLFHCSICSYMFFTHVFKKCNFKRSWEIFYWWWWCCHSFCSSCVSSHLINVQCQERKNRVEILLMLIYYEPPKIKEEEIVVWYLSFINIYGKIKKDYILSEIWVWIYRTSYISYHTKTTFFACHAHSHPSFLIKAMKWLKRLQLRRRSLF